MYSAIEVRAGGIKSEKFIIISEYCGKENINNQQASFNQVTTIDIPTIYNAIQYT